MRIKEIIKNFRLNPIKTIPVLGFIILSWLVLRQFYPPTITFWYIASTNRAISLPKKLTHESKLSFLKNCSLIVAACAQDAENYLSVFRRNIENIASLFGQYHIFIGESDSADETLTYLHHWSKQNDRVTTTTYGNMSDHISSRSIRIAYCRNDLLGKILNTDLFRQPKHTFYMVADVDINPYLNRSAFLSNFDYLIDEWGVLTASQLSGYYDIWALRNDVVNYDCWKRVKNFLVIFATLNRAVEVYVGVHQKPIPSGYQSHKSCEHVPFNLCVKRNGGKIFINPKFQIASFCRW